MFSYLKRKLERKKIRSTFKEYGYEIKEFTLPDEGTVQYAQWLNPLEQPKAITQSSVNFFKKFTKMGDFAIDIGAHTGDTTIPLALSVGKKGLVLALDPNKMVYKILEANSKLNVEKTNIVPLCAAATKENKDYYFNSSEATFNNGGVSETIKSRHGKYALDSKITGVNIESYLNAHHQSMLQKLSFVKIDTEGNDYDVIQSMTNIMTNVRPVIIAECFKKLSKDKRAELYDSLADKSYTLYHIDDFSENVSFVRLKKEDMLKWKHFDICAIPNERDGDVNKS